MMIMLFNGMQYLHMFGKVWADAQTYVDSATWFNTKDKSDIVWQSYHGWKPFGL